MNENKDELRMSEIIPLVAELTEKYTSKESSSISYAKAKQLMGAVLYCIHEKENSFECEEGLAVVQRPDVKELYHSGYEQVIRKVEQTKEMFEHLIVDFCAFGNQNYYNTIVLGMPEFFRYYDARFHPQDHILTLDYPTLLPVEPACGVDAIFQYLTYVSLEQVFFSRFPDGYVPEVLMAYHQEIDLLYCNICNIVLRNVLGCMICERKLTAYGFKEVDYNKIKKFTIGRTKQEMKEKLLQLVRTFMKQVYENNQALFLYLAADMEDFSVELKNAVEHDCLETLFSR